MKKSFAVLLLALVLSGCSNPIAAAPAPFDDFAKCLTAKGVKMYGADTCPHCKAQKATFKGSFGHVTYIECSRQPDLCQQANITSYPTWIIDGKMKTGETSLSELSELSGCTLSSSEKN